MFADVDGEIGAVVVLSAAQIVRAFMLLGRTRVVLRLYMSLQTSLFFEARKAVRVGAVVKPHVLILVVFQFKLLFATANFALVRLYLKLRTGLAVRELT